MIEEKDVIIISKRSFTGQREKFSNRALNIDPSKLNYYHCVFNINDVNDDIFKAEIMLYSIIKNHYSKNLEGITKTKNGFMNLSRFLQSKKSHQNHSPLSKGVLLHEHV